MACRRISESVVRGATTAESVVGQALARLEGDRFGAVVSVDRDGAMERAREVDLEVRRGRLRGPLVGVPVVIKDNICTRWWRTTAGSRALADFVPSYDAAVVERLAAAGAVVCAKTNCDEFAMGSRGTTSAFGPTQNPRAAGRSPGGSSSGSAAAVAGGLAPVALGSDTGGSIRLPAAWTGTVGFKPSYGAVSRRGLVAYCSSTDVIGPIGASVEDVAAVFDALAGPDAGDETVATARAAGEELPRTAAVLLDGDLPGVVVDAVRTVASCFPKRRDASLPSLAAACAAYHVCAASEAFSNLARHVVRAMPRSRASWAEGTPDCFGPECARRLELGARLLGERHADALYFRALDVRREVARSLRDIFAHADILVCPVAPHLPPRFDDHLPPADRGGGGDAASRRGDFLDAVAPDLPADYRDDDFTAFASLAGLPAITLPVAGSSSAGLPVGVQLVARRFEDRTLLAAARLVSRLLRDDDDDDDHEEPNASIYY
ncbi:hypothetical protein CTAYLR_003914 [Chrysophaeum taylorii]|uniref:Amidase domain-containing protein n=1 Tax=Chrysophaeum taylorii TaxID=2483200 RepID=A0AAD7XJK7_9STRA|nr:hypothetical protein CTAYLR_003914 [Chrysophaeum taylorii]